MRIPALPLFILVMFAAAPIAAAEAPASIGLDACIEQALAHEPRLAAGGEAERAALAAAAEAGARRLPTVDLGGSYRYNSDVMVKRFDLGPAGASELRFGDHHQADFNLGLSVPLFTGGELRLVAEAAAAGASAAGERRAALVLATRREARGAFFALLGRQAQLAAAEIASERLRRRLAETRGAVALGGASAEDSLRVLVRLREADQRGLQAAAARHAAALALGRVLGRPGDAVLARGDLAQSLLKGDGDSAALALPDLNALDRERERQELLARAARSTRLPRVSGDLRGHFGRPGIDPLANEWMPYATATLAVNWPLWDGGIRARRAQQADAGARQTALMRQDFSEGLVTARETARAELDGALGEVSAAAERVTLQTRLLALVTGRRDRAQATENEVLDAQDELSEAEIGLALARTRARQAEATLLWTLGR